MAKRQRDSTDEPRPTRRRRIATARYDQGQTEVPRRRVPIQVPIPDPVIIPPPPITITEPTVQLPANIFANAPTESDMGTYSDDLGYIIEPDYEAYEAETDYVLNISLPVRRYYAWTALFFRQTVISNFTGAGLFTLLYPYDWSPISGNALSVTPSFLGTTFPDWIMSARHGGPTRAWYNVRAFQERLVGIPCHYIFYAKQQKALTGYWKETKFSFVFPKKNTGLENVEFFDPTFLGACFASCLWGFYDRYINSRAEEESGNKRAAGRLRPWVLPAEEARLPEDNYYHSRIAFTFSNGQSISWTHVDNNHVTKIFAQLRDIYLNNKTVLKFYNEETRRFPDRALEGDMIDKLRFMMSMAILFQEKYNNIISADREGGLGSDTIWKELFLSDKPNVDSVTISLYHSLFVRRRAVATAEESVGPTSTADQGATLTTTTTVPAADLVGCHGCKQLVSSLFTKTNKTKRGWLIYDPPGLYYNEESEEYTGQSCVYECFRYHFGHHPSQNAILPSSQNYLYPSKFKDIHDLGALMNVTVNILQAAQVPPEKKFSHIIHHRVIYEAKNSSIPPIFLLIYPVKDGITTYHACLVQNKSFEGYMKCRTCHYWFKSEKHFETCIICPGCGKACKSDGSHYISCEGKFQAMLQTKDSLTLVVPKTKAADWHIRTNIWFADFECFSDAYGAHIPYLVVLKEIGKEQLHTFFGRQCLKKFIDFVFSRVKGYLFFHNGSGYDFNIVIRGMLQEKKIKDKGMEYLQKGTKIISAEIKTWPKPIYLRDFFLFMMMGLGKLCEDFKVPFELAKKTFDHRKIHDWLSAHLHRDEVERYCQSDVKALEFIYTKFSRALFDIAPVAMASSVSLAAHALEMWKIMEPKEIIEKLTLPESLHHYHLFRSMYHGGRVLPTVAKYDSTHWSTMTANRDTYYNEDGYHHLTPEDVMEINQGKNDPLVLGDVVSLYPKQMRDHKFPIGPYCVIDVPTDQQEEKAKAMRQIIHSGCHEVLGEEYDELMEENFVHKIKNISYHILKEEMFRTFYKVDIEAHPSMIIAFLFRKKQVGNDTFRPEQSLAPMKDHWVTGIELFEAIKVGYVLTSVKQMIQWHETAFVFKNYISALFEIKEKHKGDKSSALYMAAKLLMNALSGRLGSVHKTVARRIRKNLHIGSIPFLA